MIPRKWPFGSTPDAAAHNISVPCGRAVAPVLAGEAGTVLTGDACLLPGTPSRTPVG